MPSATQKGDGKWVLRFVSPVTGKRRNAGLGSYPQVGIALAGKLAREMREQIAAGRDPLDAKAAEGAKPRTPIFQDAAAQLHRELTLGWGVVAGTFAPTHVVVDLKLAGHSSGVSCGQTLHEHDPDIIIVVLTGYASIATAVEVIKLSARHYLAKPSNTDDIEAAFKRAIGNADIELTGHKTSIKTLEWEHIHETLAETGFNISEAARRLRLQGQSGPWAILNVMPLPAIRTGSTA